MKSMMIGPLENMRRSSSCIWFAIAAACLLAGCSSTSSGIDASSGASYGAPSQTLTICSGYGCIIKDKLVFPAEAQAQLRTIMDEGQESPEAEREALGKAIAFMETAARNKLRYRADIEYSYQVNSGKRGQMDCVDESLNTISFLKYLHGNGMLRHHKPINRFAERGMLFDGRYPHKSARMRQNNGVDWAVDSWKRNNGELPEIITLAEWYKGNNDASQY
ncbi:MAG: hypothetical protein ACR2O8_14070 [Rhizobiaceae bacterium]